MQKHPPDKSPVVTINPKLAYNREEAAKVLSVSEPTLDRLTARGLLNPSRATRRPLYAHEELERFLRETTASI